MNAEASPGGEVYLELGFGGLDRLRADSASAPRTRASPQFSIDFVTLNLAGLVEKSDPSTQLQFVHTVLSFQ